MTCLTDHQTVPTTPSHSIAIVLPENVRAGSAQMILDLFETANELASSQPYSVHIRRLSEMGPANSGPSQSAPNARQTVIFLGDIQSRWTVSGQEVPRASLALHSAARCVLIGGAVFLLREATSLHFDELAIHPNFYAAACEENLVGAVAPCRHTRSGRIGTAISSFAALPMLVEFIREDHGPFLAGAVSDYLGLTEKVTPTRSKEALRLQRRACGDTLIGAVLELMQDHIEEPLQIRELAREIGVSTRKLERRFQERTGISPLSAYRALRMERVHQLLIHTSLSLAEISVATGFGSRSTLSQWCRKSFGLSPKELRRRSFGETSVSLLAAE
ncbi:MAG: GlxA family transcriptional regulator [Paracoccaceae bacterium]